MTTASAADSLDVLLVEDNPGDVRLIQEAFDATPFETTLHAVSDGSAALELLSDRAPDAGFPDLLLLDLNMPGMDGFELLEALQDHSTLASLPVVVLTSSEAQEDIVKSYELSANAYLIKPDGPDGFTSLVRTVEEFWRDAAQLPPAPTV